MKSRLIFTAIAFIAMTSIALAGTIRVYNSDSKTHKVELKCSGSSKSFEIRPSTTASYTFHSTNQSCDIVGGSITFPTAKLENGQKWKIKDGKATSN